MGLFGDPGEPGRGAVKEVVFATAFINEAAAAINFIVPGIYDTGAEVAVKPLAVASRLLIDLTALISIVVIALITYEENNEDVDKTVMLTLVTLFFAFLLPAVSIRPFVRYVCSGCSKNEKVLVSFGLIGLLYGAESVTRALLKKYI